MSEGGHLAGERVWVCVLARAGNQGAARPLAPAHAPPPAPGAQRVVDAFETKTRELERENASLRGALARLQQEHQRALERLRAPHAAGTPPQQQHKQQQQQQQHASPAAGTPSTQRRRWSSTPDDDGQQQGGQRTPTPRPAAGASAAAAAAAAAGSPEVAQGHWGIVRTPGASTLSDAGGGSDLSSLSDGECGAQVVPSPRSGPPAKAAPRSLAFDSPAAAGGGGGGWGGADGQGWALDPGLGPAALDPGLGPAAQADAPPSVGDLRARMQDIKLRCRRQLSLGAAGGGAAAAAAAARPEEAALARQLAEAQALVQEQDRVLKMVLERLHSGGGA